MVQKPLASMSGVFSMIPPGPVRAAAMARALSWMLGCNVAPSGPGVVQLALTAARSPVFCR